MKFGFETYLYTEIKCKLWASFMENFEFMIMLFGGALKIILQWGHI